MYSPVLFDSKFTTKNVVYVIYVVQVYDSMVIHTLSSGSLIQGWNIFCDAGPPAMLVPTLYNVIQIFCTMLDQRRSADVVQNVIQMFLCLLGWQLRKKQLHCMVGYNTNFLSCYASTQNLQICTGLEMYKQLFVVYNMPFLRVLLRLTFIELWKKATLI